jgi:hypothetical protein
MVLTYLHFRILKFPKNDPVSQKMITVPSMASIVAQQKIGFWLGFPEENAWKWGASPQTSDNNTTTINVYIYMN